jgi:hypothetical protein
MELTAEVARFERALDRGTRELELRLVAPARHGSSVLPVAAVENVRLRPARRDPRELVAEAGIRVEA